MGFSIKPSLVSPFFLCTGVHGTFVEIVEAPVSILHQAT
jgi:hypothetical protein